MSARVVGIIQARMASTRLPGKVLLDIEGEPMLLRVVTRTARATTLHQVLVATTTDPADDMVWEFCRQRGIDCTRGSQYDVLDRYFQAAKLAEAAVVVRVTADCPLIDSGLIDQVVHTLLGIGEAAAVTIPVDKLDRFDFVSNRLPPPWRRTFPIGLDAEACTFIALERAWKEARDPHEREHVMPYLYENVKLKPAGKCLSVGTSPRGFRIALLDNAVDLGSYRWTVDVAEDLVFAREIYRRLGGRSDFTWQQVHELVDSEPQLMAINAGVRHKTLGDVDSRASSSHPT